jgi:phosphatidyl-myo-inositol dimannoside synthase
MRILMLNNEFPPLGGGTGVVNYHLLEFLNTVPDVWVDLVTSSRTRSTAEVECFGERINLYRVPVSNKNIHHASNRELLTYTWRGLSYSRKLLRERHYDLSLAFSTVPAGAISYILQICEQLPYLVSLQGPDVPGFEARYNYLYPVLKPLIRRVWSGAKIVTAISEHHRELANETMPELKIPIIYNGVDSTLFCPSDSRSEVDPVNILCVGRLIERKGQDHLLRAFARLRSKLTSPVKLTLVGTGDTEMSLKNLAKDLLIANSVDFAGVVPGEKMPDIFKRGDIFVLPSQNEGMSIALLEAMACGLPVVVTNTGGTVELVQENVNGFVVPWADVQALTEQLDLLIKDQQLRSRLGQASRQTAIKFSWDAMSQRYLELCVQIAQGRLSTSVPRTDEFCGVVR